MELVAPTLDYLWLPPSLTPSRSGHCDWEVQVVHMEIISGSAARKGRRNAGTGRSHWEYV
jgi:hypothetical protein